MRWVREGEDEGERDRGREGGREREREREIQSEHGRMRNRGIEQHTVSTG